jgi:arylsulfatase A-like enzyme
MFCRTTTIVTLLFACIAVGNAADSRPNIITYMVDDLGWNHISAGQVTMKTHPDIYHTPNIEKLANRGLSFTHAYAQPNCAPTRAAMLSGQYPARVNNSVYVVQHLNRFGGGGIKKSEASFRGPEQSEDVAVDATTVAEALKKNGYATAHIGKYHVGGHRGDSTLPENVGFDINLGGFSQGHQPSCFSKDKNGEWHFRGVGRGDFDRFGAPYTGAYVKSRGLPNSLVGTPKHICDALGDAVEETIETLSSGKKPFYLQFHSYAVHGPVRARPDLKRAAAERLGDQHNARMIEYVAFIAGMDENLGRILAAIEDPNGDGDDADSIATNTLVLFTSDNGGTHAENTPLRGKKGMFTEGGIRVPLIAYWKGVIAANAVSDRMVHSIDYYPTYLELAGRKWMPPAQSHPLDGESFADVLLKPGTQRTRKPIYYLFPGYMDTRAQPCAVVIDELNGKRYKLLYFYEADAWQLYCISDDQGEANDLIQSQPETASVLSKKINEWLLQKHTTWKPKYPLDAKSGQPVGPPPLL